MTRRPAAPTPGSTGGGGRPGRVPELEILGLEVDEAVRWRAGGARRWHHGAVAARRADGLVLIAGLTGTVAATVETIEVHAPGTGGTIRWEPLAARAGRYVQLVLPFSLT